MDTRYLQSFITVIDTGSMADAARRLDITPAAIAARLRALEEELGAPLVRRSGRRVQPTEAGLKIVDRARAVLRDLRDLRAATADGVAPGELRLGVFGSAMSSLLPAILERLYYMFPTLSVFVTPGNSVELCRQVGTNALDAALVVEPQFALGKNCEFEALVEEPLVVVAPRRLGRRGAHQLLKEEPFIRYDRTVLGGQLADRYLRDHEIFPRQRLEIDGLMAIAAMVHRGIGVALLPDWAPMWTAGLAIARVPLPDRAPVRCAGLIWSRLGPRAALAQALLHHAQFVCRRPGLWPGTQPTSIRKEPDPSGAGLA
jgi:DNA-binding transcriptional LysR family regulator